ncbi:MAG: M56 family metallopeptidase [Acidobacteriia bacterium]|nr:M56 family metallopeptidase [Terriglobia bacterium]
MNVILDSALKSTAILSAAWIIAQLLRRASADVRHRVWLAALLAVAVLPVAALSIPRSWPVAQIAAASPILAGTARAERAMRGFSWLAAIWAAGASVVMLRLLAGMARIARITRSAVERDGIFYSHAVSTPLTWGVLSPAIVLPATAAGWSAAQLDAALRHERAHILRQDWLWQTIARMIAAAFWFQPLVWLADRALRREAEQAVDDCVLASGANPAEYAGDLLAIARGLSGGAPAAAVAMVRSSELETRVRSILDDARPRSRAGWAARIAIAVVAAAIVLPLAAFQDPTVHKIGEAGLTPPRVISKVEPVYTPEARDAKIDGTVVLKCVIGDSGLAENIEVVRSVDAGLDSNAVAAVSQWQFSPARKDGKPVPVQATIEVNFHLK